MSIKNALKRPIFNTKIKSENVCRTECFLGYLVGPFCALFPGAVFGSYLNRYYSDIIGWTDVEQFGLLSAILPVVSVILAVAGNLAAGYLMDNTWTVQGKARPYILISALLQVIAFGFMFTIPVGKTVWIQSLWIIMSYIFFQAVTNPLYNTAHSSLVPLSTRNTNQRGKLATLSNTASVAAMGVGASIVVPMLLQSFLFVESDAAINRQKSYSHWQIVVLFFCIIAAVGIMTEYWFTRERVTEEKKNSEIEQKVSMITQIKVCMREKYWWVIMLYIVLFQMGGAVKNGSMSYYCRWMFDGVNTEAMAGTVMGIVGLIGGIPTAIGMIVAWPIAKRLGNKKAVVIGMIISVIGGCVSFIDVHSVVIVCIGIILKGIGSIPAMYLMLALLSEVLDQLEITYKFRSDGFTMAVYGAVITCVAGIGNGIINGLLTAGGYNAKLAAQNRSVESVLVFCYIGAELICYALIIILFSIYWLNNKKCEKRSEK